MITSSVNRVIYKGNGVATEFAYPFKIFDRTDIKVLLVDKDGNRSILTSDYYVDMEAMKVYYPGYAPGAEEPEADRPEILGEGETLVIYREVPITQMDRLPDNYPFNVIEEMDDRDCVVSQQLNDKLSRAIVVGEETGMEFDGTIAIQPGKTFAVNEEGTGFVLATNPDVIAAQITAALGVTETNVNTALMATTEYVDGKVEAAEQNVNNSLTSTENRINSALSTTEANVNRAITSNTEYVNQKTQATENNVAAALATTEGNVTAELNETKQTVNQKVEQVQALVDSLGGLTIEALEAVRDECLEKAGEAQTAADSALAAASELQGTVVQVETNTADITNIYSTKADKATSLSGYGITDAYTKNETEALLNDKASITNIYTKTETNKLLEQKISISQGTENKGKVLQVGNDGNVILSSGGGHKLVDELPSVASAEENVVYFVTSENMQGYIKNGNKLVEVCNNNLPVGTPLLWFWGEDTIPVGFIRYTTSSLSATTYPDLFRLCGHKYGGSGDEFYLPPNLYGRFMEISDVGGVYHEAGLPNITGSFIAGENYAFRDTFPITSGSFYADARGVSSTVVSSSSSKYDSATMKFDASRSNSIYGASDTVQPKSITAILIIKAFAGASASSTDLEITNVANDVVALSGRVDNIASELGATVVDSGRSSDGTIWYRKWSDSWLEQGGIVTFESNKRERTINLAKKFADSGYIALANGHGKTATIRIAISIGDKTNTSFYLSASGGDSNGYLTGSQAYGGVLSWYVCGMAGEE